MSEVLIFITFCCYQEKNSNTSTLFLHVNKICEFFSYTTLAANSFLPFSFHSLIFYQVRYIFVLLFIWRFLQLCFSIQSFLKLVFSLTEICILIYFHYYQKKKKQYQPSYFVYLFICLFLSFYLLIYFSLESLRLSGKQHQR